MTHDSPDADALLTPAEAAALFRVTANTVRRWANKGLLTPVFTIGGRRRYRRREVERLLTEKTG